MLSDAGSVLAANDGELVDLFAGARASLISFRSRNVVAELRTMIGQSELAKSEKGAATA